VRGITRPWTYPGSKSRSTRTTSRGIARLTASTTVPIAVGESMYSLSQLKDYLQAGACTAQLAAEPKGAIDRIRLVERRDPPQFARLRRS
jgi:Enolase C-terminal domain-like